MQCFKADLHIHTVLSPCGTLEMSPNNIVKQALQQKLDIIGITDHNSTKHCKLVRKIGNKYGLHVLTGAEITTREEVHCLTFFENDESLDLFQNYIEKWLPYVENNPEKIGHQVIVDEDENILDEVKPLLITGLNQSIEEVCAKVRELNGVFIPAHVDRLYSGILSQLGFIPKGLEPDAIEIWNVYSRDKFTSKYPEYKHHTLIKNSDAHNLSQIGTKFSEYFMEKPSLEEILKAFNNIEGREVKIL